MNIIIDGKYRLYSDGFGYTLKQITGEKDGKEVTKIQGHFVSLKGVVMRIFQLGHAGPEIDSVAALVDQMQDQAERFEKLLSAQVLQLEQPGNFNSRMIVKNTESEFD
jgi:hypothetical protein